VLTAARAQATTDQADADRLRAEAADTAALADLLDEQTVRLEEADAGRGYFLAATAVTRDNADRARAELARRGQPIGTEDPQAVTATEWLAEHRKDLAREDLNRTVTDEHDLADQVAQRAGDTAPATAAADAAETNLPDVRDVGAQPVTDTPGRVPPESESETAVQRTRAAVREITRRRADDDRREAEEHRVRQLTDWADDDRTHAAAPAGVTSARGRGLVHVPHPRYVAGLTQQPLQGVPHAAGVLEVHEPLVRCKRLIPVPLVLRIRHRPAGHQLPAEQPLRPHPPKQRRVQ
jgi:hypothetical protein